GTADVTVQAGDPWPAVCARLPAEWRPDFLVLHLAYTDIPEGLWAAPVPRVGLAGDWPLLWHHYRRCLGRCELVLADPAGAEVCRRAGIPEALPADLAELEKRFLEEPPAEGERDIDILFVGNLHPAVERPSLPCLGRLARLAERRRVVI